MTPATIAERLHAPGPNRILALDGDGIRGPLTLGFLERIETLLRDRHRNPDLLLCDYFDLIGGTSTGSIIAAGLALGSSVTEAQDLYPRLGAPVDPWSCIHGWRCVASPGWTRRRSASVMAPVRAGALVFSAAGGEAKPMGAAARGRYGATAAASSATPGSPGPAGVSPEHRAG